MTMPYHYHSGKITQKKFKLKNNSGMKLSGFLLCLSILVLFFPVLILKADEEEKLSSIVNFDNITLHYADANGQPEKEINQNGSLIEQNKQLVLRYTYEITEKQCEYIKAGIPYYLEISPHLILPDLGSGSPLVIETQDGFQQFGTINADGKRAWVIFDKNQEGNGIVLSEYGGIQNADFYLNCYRAENPPDDEFPVEGHKNLYTMKFENIRELNFGYAENEPVKETAKMEKGGELKERIITWTIKYTPWQNPSSNDPVSLDTSFELRDMIDTSLHRYVPDSVRIDGVPISTYDSRNDIPANANAYALAETSDGDDKITLIFGGTKFNAGEATGKKPATSLMITYQTSVNDDLILKEGSDNKKVTNFVELFAGNNGAFHSLNINSSNYVTIPQPTWLKKVGKTTRHPDGGGSTTDWEITFYPNEFSFADDNILTLHDQLPESSTLVKNSVKVNGVITNTATELDNYFTISPIITDKQPVNIIYQTYIPEEMYDSGTSLGDNTAWFTFQRENQKYTIPKVTTPVGSGDGSGTSGTATLVKTNTGYNKATREIDWKVTINPHKANLREGTFIDNLKEVGPKCSVGHTSGLEVVGGKSGITVLIDKNPVDDNLVKLDYDDQQIKVRVENIGTKTITLTYTTKVCDPCIFANNRKVTKFKNTISTDDMIIGNKDIVRKASADSTADVSSTVLDKKTPVYDYASGKMKWTVEVDEAKLSMKDVVLTDDLPMGLSFVKGSLATDPAIPDVLIDVDEQKLTIHLGTVKTKTKVTFDTKVDPEILGFGGDKPIEVKNTVCMEGSADNVIFEKVSSGVSHSFSNHGLTKNSQVENKQELIQYEVLINPYHLTLPKNPSLVDTLDRRLQLDTDTIFFYKADLIGTTEKDQKPSYKKTGNGRQLKITDFDPDTNSFTVQLPIEDGDKDAYVLIYTADIIQREADGYKNSVRFEGGSVLLGGSKDNNANVSGGGGGGGGVAARKATISVIKRDSETQDPLSGVSFMLYQWDSENNRRSLPFAQGKTDAKGKLSFKVKPKGFYELVETKSIPGYGSVFKITNPPEGVRKTDNGILIQAGEVKGELILDLTNEAHTADIIFKLINKSGIPMAGEKVQIFKVNPVEEENPAPYMEVTVSTDGTVKFPGIRRGAEYYIQYPGGEIITIEVPIQVNSEPKINFSDGTSVTLTENYQIIGNTEQERQWILTVNKINSQSAAPLAGASIGLYADSACKTLIKKDVSAQDGTIIFSGLIKGEKYWVKEILAPSEYNLDSTIYTADEMLNPIITIKNTPQTPPVNPEDPEVPKDPENPEDPELPEDSGNPGDTEVPNDPENPGDTEVSEDPGNPGDTEVLNDPENPRDPKFPEDPENPGDTEIPEKPENAEELEIASESGVSENSDNRDNSANDSQIPQTGDDTWFLIAVTLFSGFLLAVMTIYQFWRSKKREKE